MSTNTPCRSVTILAVVALAAACNTSARLPTAPTAPAPTEVAVATTAPVCNQDASPPPRVYVAADSPVSDYHGGPLGSQFFLCDDRAVG